MSTVTFIVGLCGAGKSWYVDQIVADYKKADGFLSPELMEGNLRDLINTLNSGKDAAVGDIGFCLAEKRNKIMDRLASVPNVNIRWLCIENDVEKANRNCRGRDDGRDLQQLMRNNSALTVAYNSYPEGATILHMWPLKSCFDSSPPEAATTPAS